VDNASTDGTADMIAERYPQVKLIRSAKNLGFPKGNVVAIEATTPDSRYVCLVNPDVRILPGCFHKMLDYMDKNPAIGVSGPRTQNFDGSLQRSCFRAPSVWNCWCRAFALDRTVLGRLPLFGGQLMADFAHDSTRDVEALNGAFMLIRRDAIKQVGLIDERFFMYGDDIDWSLRFRKGGWRVAFYHEAEIVHYGGGTTEKAPVYFYVEMQKANLQYWQKHHSRPAQIAYLASIWAHDSIRYVLYSVVSVLGQSWRDRVGRKAKRSMACMRWLAGSNGNAGEINPRRETIQDV